MYLHSKTHLLVGFVGHSVFFFSWRFYFNVSCCASVFVYDLLALYLLLLLSFHVWHDKHLHNSLGVFVFRVCVHYLCVMWVNLWKCCTIRYSTSSTLHHITCAFTFNIIRTRIRWILHHIKVVWHREREWK